MKNFINVLTTSLHNVLIAVDTIESVVSSGRYSDNVVITLKNGDTYTVTNEYTEIAERIREAQE